MLKSYLYERHKWQEGHNIDLELQSGPAEVLDENLNLLKLSVGTLPLAYLHL